jgi:hypothetical protein
VTASVIATLLVFKENKMENSIKDLTIRDYYAARAMQVLLEKHTNIYEVSLQAFIMADEMLNARNEEIDDDLYPPM